MLVSAEIIIQIVIKKKCFDSGKFCFFVCLFVFISSRIICDNAGSVYTCICENVPVLLFVLWPFILLTVSVCEMSHDKKYA